jgi:hypothetical protein
MRGLLTVLSTWYFRSWGKEALEGVTEPWSILTEGVDQCGEGSEPSRASIRSFPLSVVGAMACFVQEGNSSQLGTEWGTWYWDG